MQTYQREQLAAALGMRTDFSEENTRAQLEVVAASLAWLLGNDKRGLFNTQWKLATGKEFIGSITQQVARDIVLRVLVADVRKSYRDEQDLVYYAVDNFIYQHTLRA